MPSTLSSLIEAHADGSLNSFTGKVRFGQPDIRNFSDHLRDHAGTDGLKPVPIKCSFPTREDMIWRQSHGQLVDRPEKKTAASMIDDPQFPMSILQKIATSRSAVPVRKHEVQRDNLRDKIVRHGIVAILRYRLRPFQPLEREIGARAFLDEIMKFVCAKVPL